MSRHKNTIPPVRLDSPLYSHEDEDIQVSCWVGNGLYARRRVKINGHRVIVYAHRQIMERMIGRPMVKGEVVDHINGIRLDNRRENLRLTTQSGNLQNQSWQNGHRGVDWRPSRNKWRARVCFMGKITAVGHFSSLEDASNAAEKKRSELGFFVRPST